MKRLIKLVLRRLHLFGIAIILLRRASEVWQRVRFNLRNVPYRIGLRTAADGFPIPPRSLIALVSPAHDIPTFLHSGAEVVEFMQELLGRHGIQTQTIRALLDFGCGCGRVLRHWPAVMSRAVRLYGTDYNPKLVAWGRQNLGCAEFDVNDLKPPLRYSNAQFDFIYALSVFTHLPEALQHLWLDELSRVLAPKGCLIITTHGEAYINQLTAADQTRFHAGELVVYGENDAGANVCGAYHPPRWVRERLITGFELIEHFQPPPGVVGQDFYLLRKGSGRVSG